MRAVRWVFVAILAVAITAVLFLQRATAANLRSELVLLREEHREMARLKAERDRLKAAQVPSAELERLRADRAALVQLRSEIDAMKTRTDDLARREAKPSDTQNVKPTVLKIALGADGKLAVEGKSSDLETLRQRLAGLGKDARIDVSIVPDAAAQANNVKATADSLLAIAREVGLKMSVRLEPPAFTVNTAVPVP
jgi:hypothetical protein